MPIPTPVILERMQLSYLIQYPTDFDGESLLFLVRARSLDGFTWPTTGTSTNHVAVAYCPTCDGTPGVRYGGDAGTGWGSTSGGYIGTIKERGGGGNDFYQAIANATVYHGSDARYRWQSADGSNFSDYIVLPELTEPGTGIELNGYFLYRPVEQIGRGETKSIKLGDQAYYNETITNEWVLGPPLGGSTIVDSDPHGWSISFNDSTGMFTITPPLDAVPGNYLLAYYGNSTEHSHNHYTSVWFEVPCVKINIRISQSEGS